ncbi:hypothetical protein CUJ90_07230 [Paraburkholderia terricola]|nr:hypothetical protein CUJ90_07230 [Paraburkholderia terricola]
MIVEGMAARPVIAAAATGVTGIARRRSNGWLAKPEMGSRWPTRSAHCAPRRRLRTRKRNFRWIGVCNG